MESTNEDKRGNSLEPPFQGDAQRSQVRPSQSAHITRNLSPSRPKSTSPLAILNRDPESSYARLDIQILYQYDIHEADLDHNTNKNDTTHMEKVRRLEATASAPDIHLPSNVQESLIKENVSMASLQLLEASSCQMDGTSHTQAVRDCLNLSCHDLPQQTHHSSSSLENQPTEESHAHEAHESPDIEPQSFRPSEDKTGLESDLTGIGEQFDSYTTLETKPFLYVSGEVVNGASRGDV